MSTDILPFQFESQQVRVVEVDGEPWFVLADLAAVLEISSVPRLGSRLDEDMRQTHTLPTAGGPQKMTIVSEPGMYEVIVRSDSPVAKPFRRWITTEVLPSIRKTGQYGQAPALTGPALYLAAIEQATAEIAQLEARNAELEPKAARFDDYLGAKGDYTFTQAAKILQRDHEIKIGSRRLIQTLIDWGWVYRTKKGTPTPYQAQLDTKRLALRAVTFMDQHTGDMRAADPQCRVTPKGVSDIADRLNKEVAA